MSQYQDTISLICYIYEQNGKHLPICYKEMMSTQENIEFALHAFAVLMETIELMDNEEYVRNDIQNVVDRLPESMEDLEEFKKGEW